MSHGLIKYLARRAEPEIQEGIRLSKIYKRVLAIPTYGEEKSFINNLIHLPDLENTLVVVVVNARKNSPEWVHHHNKIILNELKKIPQILVIDRASEGKYLPDKQGVGLARKIACDVALKVWNEGYVESSIIYCSDADASFPLDYFEQINPNSKAVAWVFPFKHQESSENGDKILLYEILLFYKVLGLRFAHSPYAYPVLGSCIAFQAKAYAEVEGFPKLMAGEDFYFLSKIAKKGCIQLLQGDHIILSGRISERTPFGTGQSIKAQMTQPLKFPSASVFLKIKKMLHENKLSALQTYRLIEQSTKLDISHVFDELCQIGVECPKPNFNLKEIRDCLYHEVFFKNQEIP